MDADGVTVFSGQLLTWVNNGRTAYYAQITGAIAANQGFWAYNPQDIAVITAVIPGTPDLARPFVAVPTDRKFLCRHRRKISGMAVPKGRRDRNDPIPWRKQVKRRRAPQNPGMAWPGLGGNGKSGNIES